MLNKRFNYTLFRFLENARQDSSRFSSRRGVHKVDLPMLAMEPFWHSPRVPTLL